MRCRTIPNKPPEPTSFQTVPLPKMRLRCDWFMQICVALYYHYNFNRGAGEVAQAQETGRQLFRRDSARHSPTMHYRRRNVELPPMNPRRLALLRSGRGLRSNRLRQTAK